MPEIWCGREDSNFHGIAPTATSTLRVYQFRHDREFPCGNTVGCLYISYGGDSKCRPPYQARPW